MESQAIRKRTSEAASLRAGETARTVPFVTPRDAARAKRIRSVLEARKAEDSKWTGRWISDQLGVSERSVSNWKKLGTISREHSDRLAELAGVDPVLLWRGRKEQPDLLDVLNGSGPSNQVEAGFAEFRAYVAQLFARLDAVIDHLGIQIDATAAEDFAQAIEEGAALAESDGAQPQVPARAPAGQQTPRSA